MNDEAKILHQFHYQDGWYFTLLSGGDVLISHTEPGKPSDFELKIDSGGWTSIMCNTTVEGETSLMWRVMLALRGTS